MFTGNPAANPLPSGNFGGSARGHVSAGNAIAAGIAINIIKHVENELNIHGLARSLDAIDRIKAGAGTAIDFIYAHHLMNKLNSQDIKSLRNIRNIRQTPFKKPAVASIPANTKNDKLPGIAINNFANRHKMKEENSKSRYSRKTSGLRSVKVIKSPEAE